MSVLKINGKETPFEANRMPATLAELLALLGVDTATVVAEVDGRIIERANFAPTTLHDGQNIELVRFVPGG
jgi:thiamine biosynthesis protein ThiS